MNPLINFAEYLGTTTCIMLICSHLFGLKFKPKTTALICAALSMCSQSVPFLFNHSLQLLSAFFLTALLLLPPLLLSGHSRITSKIYIALFVTGVSTTVQAIIFLPITAFWEYKQISLVLDVPSQILLIIGYYLTSRDKLLPGFWNTLMLLSRKLKLLIIICVYTCCLILYAVIDSALFLSKLKGRVFLRFIVMAAVIIIIALCFAVVIGLLNHNNLKRASERLENQISEQIAHYTAYEKSITELRRFSHDYRNQSICLRAALENGDVDAALSILDENACALKSSSEFSTGNLIADALLNEKNEAAQKLNIKIAFNGSIPCDGISPHDLCVILGNALDNAVEACQKDRSDTPKKISVTAGYRSGYLLLTVVNPIFCEVRIRNNSILTTKQDRKSHGFGLYSIKNTVKQLDGTVDLSCTETHFRLEANIPVSA